MVQTQIPVHGFGWKAADFDLKGVDGKRHTLASARGPNGLVVMFICNHCPYVKAVIERIVRAVLQSRPGKRPSIASPASVSAVPVA